MNDDPLDAWVSGPSTRQAPSLQSGADPLDAWAPTTVAPRVPPGAERPTTLTMGPNGASLRPMTDEEIVNRNAQYADQDARKSRPGFVNDLRDLAGYAKDQVLGIPGAVKEQFSAGENIMNSGLADIRAGQYAPSFPSSDPSTWSGGGVLKSAAGALGAAASPLNGIVQKGVVEPVKDAGYPPQVADIAGMVAAGGLTNAALGRFAGAAADPETLRLANWAQQNGLPVRAAQISNSPLVKKLDQAVGWIPGSGRAAEDAQQAAAVNRIAAKSFGENADQITRTTIGNARDRIGSVLNDVEARTPISFDPGVVKSLSDVESDALRTFGPDNPQFNRVKNQIDQVYNVALQHGGTVPGDVWAQFYHKGSPLQSMSQASDPEIANFGGRLKSTMQDAVQRQALPEDAKAYTDARFQYKNLKTVEPLVAAGAGEPGDISPLRLAQKVATRYDVADAGPLGDLSDAARRFLRQPRDSGTPIGEYALKAITSPGTAIGTGIAGGQLLGMSIPETIGLGVAAPAINAGVARMANALLNNPVYRNSLLRGPDTSSLAKQLIYGAAPNVPTTLPQQERNPF